jgi:F0F1-type ATP synthase membrane subunit b/b'
METNLVDLLFKENLLNWIVLLAAIVWGWNKYTPAIFEARHKRIESSLSDAKTAREEGEQFFLKQQQTVANVDNEVANLLKEARDIAAQRDVQIKEQTAKDLVDLQKKIEVQIQAERQLAITELRSAAARTSIKLTEQILPKLMTADAKSKLLSQFMEQLDTANQQTPMVSAGSLESIH